MIWVDIDVRKANVGDTRCQLKAFSTEGGISIFHIT